MTTLVAQGRVERPAQKRDLPVGYTDGKPTVYPEETPLPPDPLQGVATPPPSVRGWDWLAVNGVTVLLGFALIAMIAIVIRAFR